MTNGERQNRTPSFKVKVASEALKGGHAADHLMDGA